MNAQVRVNLRGSRATAGDVQIGSIARSSRAGFASLTGRQGRLRARRRGLASRAGSERGFGRRVAHPVRELPRRGPGRAVIVFAVCRRSRKRKPAGSPTGWRVCAQCLARTRRRTRHLRRPRHPGRVVATLSRVRLTTDVHGRALNEHGLTVVAVRLSASRSQLFAARCATDSAEHFAEASCGRRAEIRLHATSARNPCTRRQPIEARRPPGDGALGCAILLSPGPLGILCAWR
jgi:hypothetical protein